MAELSITTQEVKDMLRARMLDLSRPEGFQGGVFCDEVTHQRTGRRADAIFLGMSNSKGKTLQGFEIKVSRADWLSELRDVDKADTWADECHSWTVVAPQGVVKEGELPQGFGLLEVREAKKTGNRRLVSVVKPKVHEGRVPSWEAIFGFMARSSSLAEARRKQAVKKAIDNDKEQRDRIVEEMTDLRKEVMDARAAQGIVRHLEEAGIHLAHNEWDIKRPGEPDKIPVKNFTHLMKAYMIAGNNLLSAINHLERHARIKSLQFINDAVSSVERELNALRKIKDRIE